MKYLLSICFLFLSANLLFAQVVRLDSLLVNKRYSIIEKELNELIISEKNTNAYWYYFGKLYANQRDFDECFNALKRVDTSKLNQKFKGWYFYVLGDVYRYNNREEKAYELKLKSQKIFNQIEDFKMANEVNYDLHYTLISQEFLKYDGISYILDYLKNAKKTNNKQQLLKGHLILSLSGTQNLEEISFHLQEATKYAYAIDTDAAKYRLHNYKAIQYQNRVYDLRKAKIHVDSMLYYAKILDSPDRLDSSLKTKASLFRIQGKHKEAIRELLKAESLLIKENVLNRKRHMYQYLALNYEDLGNIDLAFFYHRKMVSYRDSINIKKQNTTLMLLETAELSQKNLKIDADRIKHKNRSLLIFLVLIAVTILATMIILFYRNKKRLAEKEKEIKAIDARNEEKDRQRQRIAGELHDNLGSLIVAIKQCFDNFKASKDRFQQEEENLMSKTKELLEEAYQKVRNMAHLEDSASRTSGYWIDVIKDFAAMINEGNQLLIQVQSHGMANVIDTSVENELRIMITELIINTVKHSEASEVSVDITADENSITIIVEDDGIGLDIAQLEKQKGLGLYSIEKKTEELKGKFSIDSMIDRGTTFIIEIPL